MFFFLPVVTFIGDPFAYMLHFSGGCVLKEPLVLRHLGLGRGLFKPEEKKQAFSYTYLGMKPY